MNNLDSISILFDPAPRIDSNIDQIGLDRINRGPNKERRSNPAIWIEENFKSNRLRSNRIWIKICYNMIIYLIHYFENQLSDYKNYYLIIHLILSDIHFFFSYSFNQFYNLSSSSNSFSFSNHSFSKSEPISSPSSSIMTISLLLEQDNIITNYSTFVLHYISN